MKPTTVSFPDVNAIAILNGWVPEGGLDAAIEYPALDMLNDSGDAIREGDAVVVLADGTIAWTTTVGDSRPTGIALDDIDDGDSGPVQFFGPVDLVNVSASVTAGTWGRTAASAGLVETATTGFVYFTSGGTEPEGFVYPGGTGPVGGGGLTLADATDLFQTRRAGEGNVVYSTSAAGSAASLALDSYNTFDLTLTDACTLSFTGSLDSGVHLEWTIILRGEFTVTWPGTVQWRDTDGSGTTTPPTMTGEENVVVLTTLDGGTSYGAALDNGGTSGGAASDLTSMWVPVMVEDPSSGNWFVTVTGDGDAVMTEVPL